MNGDKSRAERTIFDEARQQEGPARRNYLDTVCAGDSSLRQRVEALLRASDRMESFLETPAFANDIDFFLDPIAESLVGTTVGRYEVVELLDLGGMGAVFRAAQEMPARIVALKVMRYRLGTPDSIRRFNYEVASLARLHHPGIVQVFEAGIHTLGGDDKREDAIQLPYFTMEYVSGAKPITKFLAEKTLGLAEKIELLLAVCDAVHHGHVNGVIHCDLKPANILVDTDGQTRIVDFGIAEAFGAQPPTGDDADHDDSFRSRPGTAQYMSPEQFTPGSAIDTRTDVYSLGVLVYESLCGRLPYDVRRATTAQASRIIRSEPPARPATMNPQINADLEAVLLKALEKNPDDRYASISELAADLRRYLAHEPVTARPVRALTQLAMMARRHPVGVIALITIVVLIVGSAGATGWLVSRLQHEREAMRIEAGRSSAYADFVRDLFDSANPRSGDRATLTVLELLKDVDRAIDRDFQNDPEIAASLDYFVGSVFSSIGARSEATKHLNRALATFYRLEMSESREALSSLAQLAQMDAESGRADIAISRIRQALAGIKRLGDRTLIARFSIVLGIVLRESSKPQDAIAALDQVDPEIAALADDRLEFLSSNTRGQALADLGRVDEAISVFHNAIAAAHRAYGPESHQAAGAQLNLSTEFMRNGEFQEALEMLREAKELFYRIEGMNSRQALLAGVTESGMLYALGRAEEGLRVARETYSKLENIDGPDDPNVLRARQNMAVCQKGLGQYDEALDNTLAVIDGCIRTLGPDHLTTIRVQFLHAEILEDLEQDEQAVVKYRELIDRVNRVFGPNHPVALDAKVNLLYALTNSGDWDSAISEGESALRQWTEQFGSDSSFVQQMAETLEAIYRHLHRDDDAARVHAVLEPANPPTEKN